MGNEPHALKWKRVASAHEAPRCGAKTRTLRTCLSPAMGNGRCRMHGGASTGPRTACGMERSRRARWEHGHYSAAAKAERRAARSELMDLRELVREALEFV